MAGVYDRLGDLMREVAQLAGGKPGQVHRWPLPETAADRVKKQLYENDMDDLFAEIERAQARHAQTTMKG